MSRKILFVLCLAHTYCFGQVDNHYVLYLLHNGKIDKAFSLYQKNMGDKHDFSCLRQMGLILLQKGAVDSDQEVKLLSMFGAGLSANRAALEIFEKGLSDKDPNIQMIALHFLSSIPDKYSEELLIRSMSSPFLPIRMEAAYYLASRKHPHALGHIEALMNRLPPFLKIYFPQFFATIGTGEATVVLKKLLSDLYLGVRIESISSIANQKRDDFLPIIRKKLTHCHAAEQEACAMALGVMRDTSSIAALKKLSNSNDDNVKLSALKSLYFLGKTSYEKQIIQMAKKRNLFAINALGSISGSEDLLFSLTKSRDMQVKINAALALLMRKDPRSIPPLEEILIQDSRDLAFQMRSSLGKAHRCLSSISSAWTDTEKRQINLGISFSIKEYILDQTLQLPEKDFFTLCGNLFNRKQQYLIPHLIALCEKNGSKAAISFLKKNAEKTGAPLIRAYCNLALFRLGQKGPYKDRLHKWVLENIDAEIIKLRTILPWKDRLFKNSYLLTEKENSQLFIDIINALSLNKDLESISLLLEVIKKGNPKNKYVLAGLLVRAVE